MLDHAGGEDSSLLSSGLMSSRDGIAGYWNGAKDPATTVASGFGTAPSEITYLRLSTRALMLDHELVEGIKVGYDRDPGGAPKDGLARLHTQGAGAPFLEIQRPSLTQMERQLKWLRTYADLRDDRLAEISTQQDDILSYFGAVAFLDDQRRLRSLEIVEAAVRLAIHVELKVKHLCRMPRPIDFSREVQPIVQTPDHSAFPSGHSTEAFLTATILHRLMTGKGPKDGVSRSAQLYRLAHRIASNRTVAGVHFPIDSAAGALMGCLLGEYIYGLAFGVDPTPAAGPFRAMVNVAEVTDFQIDGDFTLDWLGTALPNDIALPAQARPETSIFGTFWAMAQKEWW